MNTVSRVPPSEPSAIRQLVLQVEIFLRDVWRYRWTSIITVWVIATIGWAFVYTIPDRYEASAKILVDTDSILRPLLKGLAVETDIQSKLSMMSRTLLSRSNLDKLVRATDMDINISSPEGTEELHANLRSQINIKVVGGKRRSASKESLYTITYQNKSPEMAKEVVQTLLTIFVETTLGGSRQDSDVAQKFLGRQLKDYEAKLVETEKRLMEFKRKNIGMIPGQGKDYFSILQETQNAHEQAQFELTQVQNKHDELKRQLDEMIVAASKPGSTSIPTATDDRIDALEKHLDNLLLKYTEEHPDVTEIQHTIVALKEKKKQELELIATGASSNAVLDSNLVYQELRVALGQALTEVATAKVRVNEYARRIKNLKGRVDTLPKIEVELAGLVRDYNINKAQYDTLLARLESAKISRDAESAGDQVKFNIIEPPHVPSIPSSPNRPLFNAAVLLIALGGGLGLVFLVGQFNPVVHEQRTLRELTGYPVFGSISLMRSTEMVRKRKLAITIYAASIIALTLVFVVIVVVQSIL